MRSCGQHCLGANSAHILRTPILSPPHRNRPSDLIKKGVLSLHGPDATVAPGGGAAGGGAAGGGAGAGASAAAAPAGASTAGSGLYAKAERSDFAVEMEAEDGGGGRARGGGGGGGGSSGRASLGATAAIARAAAGTAPASDVAASSLPDHLRMSSITGEASRVLGFVQIAGGRAGAHAAGGAAEHGRHPLAELEVEEPEELLAAAAAAAAAHRRAPASCAGDAAYVVDTNINADQDADAAGDELSNEALWQALFAQAQAEAQGGAASAAGGGEAQEEEDWEDA